MAPDEGTANTNTDDAAAAAAAAAAAGSQNTGDGEAGKGLPVDAATAFAELEPESREWLGKQGYVTADGKVDLIKLGRQVHNQEKLLGNAIRIPGKDATPEEREAFLNKLGRPETADKYEFQVPKDLPEELPYDGEAAKAYGAKAHELGLTKSQAQGLHDWYAQQQVELYKGFQAEEQGKKQVAAKASADALVKRWGPLDGETAKANLAFADRVLQEAEPGFIEEMQSIGVIGPNKEVLSEKLAVLFAKVGSALFKEGDVLRGNNSLIGNPYEDQPGKPANLTEQMRVYRENPSLALSLIAAAGKKPEDFGLKAQ